MTRPTLSDIKLGWFQRFGSVATHQSIIKSAAKIHVDATCVSDSIQDLERGLNRMLIAPGTAQLTTIGRSFVNTNIRILAAANIAPRIRANVSIGSFQSIIAISEQGSYVAAAKALGWSRYKVMRKFGQLQMWIDEPLTLSGPKLRLSPKGEEIASIGREIVDTLRRFQGPSHSNLCRRRPRKKAWWLRTYGMTNKIPRIGAD